jgi:hypothetical protein
MNRSPPREILRQGLLEVANNRWDSLSCFLGEERYLRVGEGDEIIRGGGLLKDILSDCRPFIVVAGIMIKKDIFRNTMKKKKNSMERNAVNGRNLTKEKFASASFDSSGLVWRASTFHAAWKNNEVSSMVQSIAICFATIVRETNVQ